MPDPRVVLEKLDLIEAEMRKIGLWQNGPLEPDQYDFRAAFAGDTMTFSQWLQFILLPNVKSAVEKETFPSRSRVAAQAVREFDGLDEASNLITILSDFDALF